MGPATTMPGSLFMGELSLLPTHTPVTISLVYPTTQPSLKSWVGPVFAATFLSGKKRRELGPNMGVLAALSERISVISCVGFAGRMAIGVFVFSWSIVPCSFMIFIIPAGGMRLPSVANTPYAD